MKINSFDWRAPDWGALDWRIGLAVAAGMAVAGGVLAYRWLNRSPDPDLIERQRRSHLNRIGRIAEGRVVELLELAPALSPDHGAPGQPAQQAAAAPVDDSNLNGKRQVVCYSYSISGVVYETTQDVTGLDPGAAIACFTAGQSASVKYDPANPSNSILIADNWSGVR